MGTYVAKDFDIQTVTVFIKDFSYSGKSFFRQYNLKAYILYALIYRIIVRAKEFFGEHVWQDL